MPSSTPPRTSSQTAPRLPAVATSLVALLCLATSAFGAPTLSGRPRALASTDGGVFADLGSELGLAADILAPADGLAGALTLIDGRPGSGAENETGARLATLRFEVDDGVGPWTGERSLAFAPWGWEETFTPGGAGGALRVRVVAIARNGYLIAVDAPDAAETLTLRATLAGELTEGSGTVSAGDLGGVPLLATVALDPGADGSTSAGIALAALPGDGTLSSSQSGGVWHVEGSWSLQRGASLGLLMGMGADVDEAAAVVGDALDGLEETPELASEVTAVLEEWVGEARTRWEGELAAYPPANLALEEDGGEGALEADEAARAILSWNQLRDPEGALLGAVASKGARGHFEELDSALQARALAEADWREALAVLGGPLRGQVSSSGDDDGRIPARVAPDGSQLQLEDDAATELYSGPPALPWSLQHLWERSPQDATAASLFAPVHGALERSLGWWERTRDWDDDGVLEWNGALEAAQPASPRFTEAWPSVNELAELPVDDSHARAPLNAVDLNAWVAAGWLALSRTADGVGVEGRATHQARALGRNAAIEQAFRQPETGRYFDYVWSVEAVGADETAEVQRFAKVRGAWTAWPLAMATLRNPAQAKRFIEEELLDPAQFWSSLGVRSLAQNEASHTPAEAWNGALQPLVQLLSMETLFRYGFEAEAALLRDRFLSLAEGSGFCERYHGTSGACLGAVNDGSAAAAYVLAARHRHEEEGFVLERGLAARARSGHFRRLFRVNDGQVVLEVSDGLASEATSLLPRTTLSSEEVLFSGRMTVALEDPYGHLGDSVVRLHFPLFSELHVQGEEPRFEPSEGEGIVVEARAGDVLELLDFRYSGERGCGGCSGGSRGEGAAPGVALLLLVAWVTSRRLRRRATSASRG